LKVCKKGILYFILLMLVLHPVLSGFANTAEAAVSSPITTIENSTGMIEVLDAESIIEDGKIKVTATVINHSEESKHAGISILGKDSNNQMIETIGIHKVNDWGAPVKVESGQTITLEGYLQSASLISSVVVIPTGNSSEVSLISSAYRHENGKVIVTGVVENGSDQSRAVGLMTQGLTSLGEIVEVMSNQSKDPTWNKKKEIPTGSTHSFTLELNAGHLIEDVETTLTGNSTGTTLLTYGSYEESGKYYVTGVIENGTATAKPLGMAITGVNADGKAVETKSAYTKDNWGKAVSVEPNSTASLSITIESGSQIAEIQEPVLTGFSEETALLTYGVRQENAKIIVTGVVENGSDTNEVVELQIITLDKNGNEIDNITNRSIDQTFHNDKAIEPGVSYSFQQSFDELNVRQVKIDTPDKINSTANIVQVQDITPPLIASSYPEKNDQSIDVQDDITVTFNENVTKGNEFQSIRLASKDGNLVETTITLENQGLTIQPNTPLAFNKQYSLVLPQNSISDESGNTMNEYQLSFRTASEGSAITSSHIIHQSDTWNESVTINTPLIIAPNTTLTINEGVTVTLQNDLIIYGTIINNGTIQGPESTLFANVYKQGSNVMYGDSNYMNDGLIETVSQPLVPNMSIKGPDHYPIPPISISAPTETAVEEINLEGQTIPGFTVIAGNEEYDTNSDGTFSIPLTLSEGENSVYVQVRDNFNRTHTVTKHIILLQKDNGLPAAPVVDEVTDQSTSITGTAEPGSNIKIMVGDQVIGEGAVNEDGRFSIEIAKQKADTELVLTAEDESGNVSEEVVVTVKDATPPGKPFIDEVTDQSTSITGTAEPGSNIKIMVGDQLIGEGTVNEDGRFFIEIPKQQAGTELNILAEDENGNVSEEVVVTVKDATPPGKPVIDEVTDQSTSITGTAEPGSNIKIMVGDQLIGEDSVNEDGRFSIEIEKQKAGTELVITAEDESGNVSEEVLLTVAEAPAPIMLMLDEVTNQSTAVTGMAEAGSLIRVWVNDSQIGEGTADEKGNFSISIPPQEAGTDMIITAVNKAGTLSEEARLRVTDATPPATPEIYGDITDQSTFIYGKTTAGSLVKVSVENTVIGESTAYEDGYFYVMIPPQQAGTKLAVTVTDLRGLVSEAVVLTVKDGIAPAKPRVDKITDQSEVISGSAEVDTTILVKRNSQLIGEGVTDADGYFSIKIDKQSAETVLIITAVDQSGNASDEVSITVKDGTPPPTPVIDEVTDQSTFISGTAEAGSTIEVSVGESRLAYGKTDDKGYFTFSIPKQRAGIEIIVTASDLSGNTSERAIIIVKDVTPPVFTGLNEITDQSTSVDGMVDNAEIIRVHVNGELIGETVPTVDGQFKLTFPLQKAGTMMIFTAIDSAGNISEEVTKIVTDITPPGVPKVEPITDQSTSINGTAEIGAVIEVKVDDEVIGEVTVNDEGHFSFEIPILKLDTIISFTAKDKAGNVSESLTIKVKDGTPPVKPEVDEVTDQSTEITGTAEARSTIIAKMNGEILGKAEAENGHFSIQVSNLKAGSEISLTATDEAGNTSEETKLIVKDKTLPMIPTVQEVTERTELLTGKAEENSTIKVYVNQELIGEGRTNEEGNFSIHIPFQKSGTKLFITSTDSAGNVSETTVVVSDTIAPDAPIVDPIYEIGLWITGKTEPFALVKVKLGGKDGNVLESAKADKYGNFTVVTPAYPNPGLTFYVTATDESGNESGAATVVTKSISSLRGWEKIDNTWYYFDLSNGEMKKGWANINGDWYYFNDQGNMLTGWIYSDNRWYFLDKNGEMKTGWIKLNNKWYYLHSDGSMKTGWVKHNSQWYYLNKSGEMKTGWVYTDGKWYFLSSNGAMKVGWLFSNQKWYYLKTDGSMITEWKKINNKWYYFYQNGRMASDTTVQGYKLGKDGAWIPQK
jgi:glucan-binding YG repeat protein/methionine-rich copper-binding protein CopC